MNAREARQILLLYRPGPDDPDPEVAAALEFARGDPELAAWLQRQQGWHAAMRQQLRSLPVPAGLAERIVARERKIARPVFRRPVVWRAAAMLALLLGLAALWLRPAPPERFADYQARMVRMLLREYRLDARSGDPHVVRQYMAQRGGPADYELTRGLERLQLAGGGFVRWRNEPVSMICFYRPDKRMVYLLVMDRDAVKDPPPTIPRREKVKRMLTASWTKGDRIYLLAGPEETDFYRKYLE